MCACEYMQVDTEYMSVENGEKGSWEKEINENGEKERERTDFFRGEKRRT